MTPSTSVPTVGAPMGPDVSGAPGEQHPARPGDPETLLLVEDDPGDAVLVEELLADSGLRATLSWARSLAEATELLRTGGPHGCILLDLHLPDGAGLEVVTKMLTIAPGMPVVVLTALAEESAGLAAVAAGAQDYLIKGQSPPDVFSRAIRYAAQRKHAERASAELQLSALRAEENARLERGLLPTPLVHSADFEVVARYRPGREQALVGGDFYDIVETPDGTVHAVIGDVSGHGAAAAAIGVCLRVAWRSLVLAGATGQPMIGLLEQMLVAERESENVFATLTLLTFAADRRTVRILRAGHPGLLLRTPGRVEFIEGPAGPALGLVTDVAWRTDELPLPAGAGLVLFTDGLFEGRVGPGSERLGEDGLVAMAREIADLPAAAFLDALIGRTEAAASRYGGPADDIAVLHLSWKAAS